MRNIKKLAKIAWNGGESYLRPFQKTYKKDKSKWNETDSFLKKYGYGHEEWMLSPILRDDNDQYAFIQAFQGSSYNSHESKISLLGKKIDLTLITYNPSNGQWYHVGCIYNLEVLSSDEAYLTTQNFIQNGAINLMLKDLNEIGANQEVLIEFSNHTSTKPPLVNVRFNLNEAKILKDYIPLKKDEMRFKHDDTLYNLDKEIYLYFKDGYDCVPHDLLDPITLEKGPNNDEHRRMQLEIFQILSEDDRFIEVEKEFLCKGLFFDLWMRDRQNGNYILEIKTYEKAIECIREAIGQILEYSFNLNIDKNNKLVIIGKNKMTEAEYKYLCHLRNKYSLNIMYTHYSPGSRKAPIF